MHCLSYGSVGIDRLPVPVGEAGPTELGIFEKYLKCSAARTGTSITWILPLDRSRDYAAGERRKVINSDTDGGVEV